MKKTILALVSLGLVGCTEMGYVHHRLPAADVTYEQDVANIIADENAYRLGLGQTQLSQGLSCQLLTVTSGTRLQASIPGHDTFAGITHVATFLLVQEINQPNSSISQGLNLLPNPLRNIYKNMYKLVCQGHIVVTESSYYEFTVASDDASVLYVGGTKVVDNDNNHAVTTVSGFRYLRRGVHAFRLDYAQAGGGSQALIVKSNQELINPNNLVH